MAPTLNQVNKKTKNQKNHKQIERTRWLKKGWAGGFAYFEKLRLLLACLWIDFLLYDIYCFICLLTFFQVFLNFWQQKPMSKVSIQSESGKYGPEKLRIRTLFT